jgi:hypothetical protein
MLHYKIYGLYKIFRCTNLRFDKTILSICSLYVLKKHTIFGYNCSSAQKYQVECAHCFPCHHGDLCSKGDREKLGVPLSCTYNEIN